MSKNQQKFSAAKCILSSLCSYAFAYLPKILIQNSDREPMDKILLKQKGEIRSVTVMFAGQGLFNSKLNVCCCFSNWKEFHYRSALYLLIFFEVIYEYAILIDN